MPFVKLFKLDNGEKEVTTLHNGEHVFGRDSFLECNDKRVSRKHGILTITDEGTTITPIHINPCFYIPVDNTTIKILPKDIPTKLRDGDKFALLPDQFWFKVKFCNDSSSLTINSTRRSISEGSSSTNGTVGLTVIKNEEPEDEEPQDKDNFKTNNDIKIEENQIEPDIKTEIECDRKRFKRDHNGIKIEETEMIKSYVYHVKMEVKCEDSEMEVDIKSENEDPSNTSTEINTENEETEQNPSETRPQTETEEAPREPVNEEVRHESVVRQQPETRQQNVVIQPVIKFGNDSIEDQQVPDSVEQTSSSDDSCAKVVPDKDDASVSGQKKKRKWRDRCWYGKKCYRKNQHHRVAFSHPGDSDFESDPEDNRPSCFYGAGCYRRNSAHRRHYKHPKNVAPPPKRPRPKPNDNTTADPNTAHDDDDLEDDYDLEDPFIDDGSEDEYQPDNLSDESDSEWTESQGADEEEDTKRLVKEAKRFTRNEK